MSLSSRSNFLKFVALCFALYGLLWALAPFANFNLPARLILDISQWPLDNYAEPLTQRVAWLSSISAGLLIALSVFLWGVVAPAIEQQNESIIRATIAAMTTWYLVDGVGSVAAGVASNVFFNTIYFALVIVPLVFVKSANK